ncbi:MAG TPA: ATP-dependent zinc metalloprotease FtsH [Solirubrobacteraceae bacterium]|nr:ATP-dependent zinc metalloprotease FtsH [Solirubrobacteraceae bacterium]
MANTTTTKPKAKPKVQNTMKGKSVGQRFADSLRGIIGAIAGRPLMSALGFTAILLLILFFIGISILTPRSPGSEISFSQAENLIATPNGVQQATLLDQDARLQLVTPSGQQLWTAYPSSNAYTSQLLTLLNKYKVPTTVNGQAGKVPLRFVVQFLLPILILVTLFGLITLLAREQGGMIAAFSKWSGRKQKAGSGRSSFNDVAGAPEALVELREFVDYLENPMRYAELGARAPKGVLLVGPPGTGKTLLARAVAGEAAANFFSISGSEFVESLVGVGAARVRDLFRQARDAAPSIIFIDELDAVGRQRGAGMGQGHDEREQTLNQMLVEMDGFGAESGVVVMAATNRPDILDNALLRPGRFDRQVVVDLPDVHGRTEILGLHASKSPVSRSADLGAIAHQTPGFSGADLANVINEASLLAVRAGKVEVEQEELEEAIDRVLMGPARKSHLLTPDELWRIAVHECGHAIVARSIDFPAATQKLSVVARGRGRGGATIYASSDQLMLTELDLTKQLTTMMAGAAAESYVFGMLSTGVEDDIEQATKVAHAMVAVYGMSPAIGPVLIGQKEGQVFIGRDLANMGNVAPAALELVDGEVRRLVHEAEETAKRVLAQNTMVLEDLANSLLRAETLSGPSLDVYMEAVTPWRRPLINVANEHEPPILMRQDSGDEYADDAGDEPWDDRSAS